MSSKKQHMHWISAIETLNTLEPRDGDPYGGIRQAIHHTEKEAKEDVKLWIEEELDQKFETYENAVNAYQSVTGKRVRMETQYA